MKKTLIFLFLSLASLAIASRDPALITVVGDGSVVVSPDYADITLGVTLTDDSAQDASNQVDQISSNIIAYLQERGVADRDIQTSYVSVQPVYSYEPMENQEQQFTATKTVDFTLRDLSRYDEIIQGLFGVGANTINNVQWRANNLEEKQETARARAAQNAREIAENLAKSLGVQVGAVFSINDQSSGGYYAISYGAQQEEASAQESTGPSVAEGVISITATVQVQFFIEQKGYDNFEKEEYDKHDDGYDAAPAQNEEEAEEEGMENEEEADKHDYAAPAQNEEEAEEEGTENEEEADKHEYAPAQNEEEEKEEGAENEEEADKHEYAPAQNEEEEKEEGAESGAQNEEEEKLIEEVVAEGEIEGPKEGPKY